MPQYTCTPHDFQKNLEHKARSLGFSHIGSSNLNADQARRPFTDWIRQNFHGQMGYMEKHGELRFEPESLVNGTKTILMLSMPYFNSALDAQTLLKHPDKGYIAHYALGRDYHKVVKRQLNQLGLWLQQSVPDLLFRSFTDSAPLMERTYAHQAGLGFFGKNTMIIDPTAGSFFFLGALLINQPINLTKPMVSPHCGRCRRCIDCCPTQAIVAPYVIDARKCISYLTIEHTGSIPLEHRKSIGNRIFGCDDCQLYCPWNRFAKPTTLPDFEVRNEFNQSDLCTLFSWTEAIFNKKTAGSPIYRLGYARFMRNIAIALGNAPYHQIIQNALQQKTFIDAVCQEHINWALNEQHLKQKALD